MLGQTIEYQPPIPYGSIFWLLLAASLDVLAVVEANPHYAVASLLPWLASVLLWRVRSRPLTVRFTETALEVGEPPLQIPYADLQGLVAPRRPANPFKAGPRSYLIQVIHTGGVVCIPARLDVPSDEVFSFLYRQLSPSGSREVPSGLMDFLRRKERAFGPEKVWTYRARTHLGQVKQYPERTALFLALALAAAGWLAWGIARGQDVWIGCGGFGLFIGLLFCLLFWIAGRHGLASVRGWRKAGLVIAPDGLALVQGDLVGELSWDEVREVKLGKPVASFQLTTSTQPPGGLVLKVEGAVIVIADVYDRPLSLLYQHIRYYWRGETTGEDWKPESMPPASGEGMVPSPPDGPFPLTSEGRDPHD